MTLSNHRSVGSIIDPDLNKAMSKPNKEYLDLQKQREKLLQNIQVYERSQNKSINTN